MTTYILAGFERRRRAPREREVTKMRGRRVISLLLSLVMALSLCSGVWAENEVTASDEGVTVNYAERTVRFYPVMNGGYLKYDPDDPNELKVDGRNIEYTVGDDTRTIPAFFIRATGDFSEAYLFLAIDKNNGEETAPTLLSSDGWLTLRNEDSNDKGKFVYALSVTDNRNNGDTAFITLDGQTLPFAIVFEENNGGGPQSEALTDFKGVLAENENGKDENDNSKLTDAQKKVANDYVDKYLLNSNGYVKNGDSDKTGILLKDGKDYTDAEVAAIKAAVKAFRAAEWQVHDALGNVQGVKIEGDRTDCFGHYLAELASRVGISLWGDYPSGDNAGVFMTLTGGSRLQLATDNAYGVLAYDESVNVKADEQTATYKVPYDRNYYAFAVTRTDDKRITSVKVENAACQEMEENGEVYGQKCTVANGESNSFEVNTYNNGWSISNEIAKSYFEINVDRWDEEFELTFVINYVSDSDDSKTAVDEFTIKFVEPVCDWTFNDGSKPTNASDLLNVFYDNGYKFPKLESYATVNGGASCCPRTVLTCTLHSPRN